MAKNVTSALYIIITSFHNPVVSLHHSVLFHHPLSIAWPGTGLRTQTGKLPLHQLRLSLLVSEGEVSASTTALAVNQFLPGYHLSAPRSLSYYSAAVHSSATPAWSGLVRTSTELCSQSPLSPPLHSPYVSNRTLSWGLPPQVSATFFSSSCQSLLLFDESFNSPVLPNASLPPTPLLSLSLSLRVGRLSQAVQIVLI